MRTNDQLTFGLIGKGNFGSILGDALKTLGNLIWELDSSSDFTKSKLPDWVFIATPNVLHYEQAEYFLNQGVNVFIEKPSVLNSEALKIDRSFRNDQSKQAAFLKILKGKNKVNRSLRIMNKCSILGQFIPMFGKIVAQMQHDLFHIYTVDEHTLNVVENLRRFSKLKLKHEFPDFVAAFPSKEEIDKIVTKEYMKYHKNYIDTL